MSNQRTHWEGCEAHHGHSECAKRVIDELRAQNAALVAALEKIERGNDEEFNLCDCCTTARKALTEAQGDPKEKQS